MRIIVPLTDEHGDITYCDLLSVARAFAPDTMLKKEYVLLAGGVKHLCVVAAPDWLTMQAGETRMRAVAVKIAQEKVPA